MFYRIRGRASLVMVLILAISILQLVRSESAEAAEVKLNIVAMGDSYTSGNGALDYFGATGCYRSHNNYVQKLVDKIGSGIKVEYRNLACMSAVTGDLPGQLQSMTHREREAVDLVLLTIGGNDAGFTDVLKQCFAPALKDAKSCREELDKAKNVLTKVMNNMLSRMREIAVLMPRAKIVLVGYPNLIDNNETEDCTFLLYDGGLIVDAGSESIGLFYQLEAHQSHAVDQINREYGNRAQFVSLKSLFKDHEKCGDKDLWIRGFFDTLNITEWWHPNKEGHAAIASHLYSLGVHKGQEDIFRYGNLPLACGYRLPYVSTYGTMSDGSRTWSHGYALDMPAVSGTHVLAPVSGVAYVKYSSGYGNFVDLVGDDGRLHRMAHMQGVGLIASGRRVVKGQKLGLVGSTGNSTGPHVHYEQRISGSQVAIKLSGPGLEWGPDYTSYGDRRTTHSLESGNCSSSTTSSSGADTANELIIYRATDGRRIFHDVRPDAGQTAVAEGTWRKGWDIIVQLEIDGDAASEVLFYDAETTAERGGAYFYNLGASNVSKINSYSWSNYWTHMVPIDLDGDKRDELIVYSATNGRYYIFDVRPDGRVVELRSGTWSKGWEIIEALEFDKTKGQELLFYKSGSDRGKGLIYDGSPNGLGALLQSYSWSNGWTHMVPLDIEGDGTDEILIYRSTDGRWIIHDVYTSGRQYTLSHGYWSTGWKIIETLEIDGDRGAELMFYNPNYNGERGRALFYDAHKGGLGPWLKEFFWSKGWTIILPVQMPS